MFACMKAKLSQKCAWYYRTGPLPFPARSFTVMFPFKISIVHRKTSPRRPHGRTTHVEHRWSKLELFSATCIIAPTQSKVVHGHICTVHITWIEVPIKTPRNEPLDRSDPSILFIRIQDADLQQRKKQVRWSWHAAWTVSSAAVYHWPCRTVIPPPCYHSKCTHGIKNLQGPSTKVAIAYKDTISNDREKIGHLHMVEFTPYLLGTWGRGNCNVT